MKKPYRNTVFAAASRAWKAAKIQKPYRYTIFTVVLALLFSLGSMAGMALILKEREGQLLAEEGEVQEDVPVREWQGDGNILTMEQMEEAVGRWEKRTAMKVHKPVKGQISMEEAIQEGEAWLAEMGLEWEKEKSSIYATLGAPVWEGSGERILEPYYSFWWLEFSGSDRRFFLYVNAVTGKVWSAEINLQQALPMEMSRNRLRKFVLLSGVEPSDAESEGEWKSEDKDKERAGYRNLEISHSRLYARELWYTNEAFPHSGENNQELVNLQEMLNLYLHEEEPISKAAPF